MLKRRWVILLGLLLFLSISFNIVLGLQVANYRILLSDSISNGWDALNLAHDAIERSYYWQSLYYELLEEVR